MTKHCQMSPTTPPCIQYPARPFEYLLQSPTRSLAVMDAQGQMRCARLPWLSLARQSHGTLHSTSSGQPLIVASNVSPGSLSRLLACCACLGVLLRRFRLHCFVLAAGTTACPRGCPAEPKSQSRDLELDSLLTPEPMRPSASRARESRKIHLVTSDEPRRVFFAANA